MTYKPPKTMVLLVMVKNSLNHQFLQADATWQTDQNQAHQFKTHCEAALFCALHCIKNAEVVFASIPAGSDSSGYNIPIDQLNQPRSALDE